MYKLIDNHTDFLEALDCISTANVIGLDTETTGLDCFVDELVLVQVKASGQVFLFAVRNMEPDLLKQLASTLATKFCILHNAKFDMKFLYNATGIWLTNCYCTMIMESVLNAGRSLVFLGLKDLVMKYCNFTMDKEDRMEFVGLRHDEEITEDMLTYSAIDVEYLEDIYNKQMQIAKETRELDIVNLECNLIPVVAKMEYTGVKLDEEEWMKLEGKTKQRLEELRADFNDFCISRIIEKYKDSGKNCVQIAEELLIPVKGGKKKRSELELETDMEKIREWLYCNFNAGSWRQVLEMLRMEGVKADSTNEKVIAKFANDFEIVKKLLDVREVAKQFSTYGRTWLANINSTTKRVHTNFFSGGTDTGRFSSSNPNMQNVPTHGGFRECFVPAEDYVFISCDYSQQEYRLAGAVSREPVIIDAYRHGSDMHTSTAANFYKKAMNDITKDERSWGKTRNFEIIYGTTEWGLSKSLKSTVEYAKDVLDKYWAGYPTLFGFKTKVEEKILELGYSCTPMGRRRYILERPVFSTPRELEMWKARVKREGFNVIIQGGGADIIKIAMVNLSRNNPFGDKLRMILQIHDELVFEVHKSIVVEAGEFIRKEMVNAEQPFLGEIPAVVEGYDQVKTKWTK